MKKLILILALLTFMIIHGLSAHALVYWSENFNGFSQEWVCQLSDCGLVPGVPPGYTEFHANTMGTPDATTAITTAAHMGTPGANNRGFRITFGGVSWPTGESVLKKYLGGHKTGVLYLRWYQRDSDPASYSNFQKLFRITQDAGQILIPEWQSNGSQIQMNLWDAGSGSNHFFTGYNLLTDYTPGTWACYEIKMDLTNKAAEFWVNGVSKGTLNASAWWATGWYISYVEIGGNQYIHDVGETIDYDDIILSDTYNGCGEVPPGDTTPPVAGTVSPYGSLRCSYNPLTLDIRSAWSEECTARYSTTNVTYDSMTGSMTRVSGTYDQYTLVNLVCNAGYTIYMGCRDAAGNTGYTSTNFTVLAEESIPIEPGTIGVGSGGAYLPGSGGAFIQN